ncbi:putative alpha-1,3-glucan synthase [Eremomyces bilateralis CBS 781.70]|uniref:alpha-1,3-glucan synthase n=1 Tax=Eremomyces bilateralis CBS 781.70 TaxID=1392243 RepID=A0A6G1GHD4_9PEZI|nr:putative alpha-1,3-glucan synthase [Eremomyces bilateralis CBS 781.70]KAF1817463.1 putative alpha-1,3-glucan synthase [Eremomyces bilateralis CBS 781.70]
MFYRSFLFGFFTFASGINALRYDPEYVDWNLNTNEFATNPTDYSGKWENHDFHISPDNWRFPFYTIFLDRFVNGDPSNDNINGTAFEVDILSNQLRNGGDIAGLQNSLDYLQGMGVQGIYLAGSPHINQPWSADSFSPLDLTMLDWHYGNITAWRDLIDDMHARGMYVVLDNTISTMGDLIGFDGYLNTSTPFSFKEHKAVWKTDRQYLDFVIDEDEMEDCEYPRFWDERGERVGSNVTDLMTSCKRSDFDQYGDVASFGEYPEWQKQLSKFGFVQDRLREWQPSVMDKIVRFSCLTIQMLDIDGFRIDKALTITLDAQAEWSKRMRECAAEVGKTNFLITGEIVAGNALAALYLGRGKEPQMAYREVEDAFLADNDTDLATNIRDISAMDSATFHYSVYRSLTRFLGIDGVYGAQMDIAINWAKGWQDILKTNDMINTNTGKFDPLHLYGTTNQDVFRWPGITNGTKKNLLGNYVTTMIMPGIPILMWGEEQAMYVLENTVGNYLFGRQPLSSTIAWQLHGCYRVGSEKYDNFPFDQCLYGCEDMNVSLDHRDPSHPIRNVIKRMYEIRRQFPTVNDGFMMEQLSTQTHWVYLPGSGGTGTELGMWSSVRRRQPDLQDFTGQGAGNEMVWLLFSNENQLTTFNFDCATKESNREDNKTLVAPFDAGTTVKNLFYPYEEYTLESGGVEHNFENTTGSGCLSAIDIPAWGFKALVQKKAFKEPAPSVTKFLPGHDYRLQSRVGPNDKESIKIEFHFSEIMDCDSVRDSISLTSETHDGSVPIVNRATVQCLTLPAIDMPEFSGEPAGVWQFITNLDNLANGIHRITLTNATSKGGEPSGTKDNFFLRVGQVDNPMVFPQGANYSTSLVKKSGDKIRVEHRAPGATKFRVSRDYQSSWTDWMPYDGNTPYEPAPRNWTGTKKQDWEEEHIIVQYWSHLAGSSHHQQEGDLIEGNVEDFPPRRFPHVFINGLFNQFGFDSGMKNQMSLNKTGFWNFDFMADWPTNFQFNIWGMNPSGQPDKTWIYGDVNKDKVLDRLPPGSLLVNVVNITEFPKPPFAAWRIVLDDRAFKYTLLPTGSSSAQLALFCLLWFFPLAIAAAVVYIFIKSYYQVKFNEIGAEEKSGALIPLALRNKLRRLSSDGREKDRVLGAGIRESFDSHRSPFGALQADAGDPERRTVLIATMEYDIEDWKIKIKIGGLGVMAQLMGKNLGHQDLIWVVPCVGGMDYPIDQVAEPMYVTILGKDYKIDVQYHKLRNITYVLLDAPLFRQQTKNDPYPARMDDLDSAILYSAWNSCIAEAIRRFPVDIYHINDYHGALAPLHLLPEVIPACLSLHNAEFQGLWPMRTEKEKDEVCKVFNIDPDTAAKYVQFGEVFNLLHAGASYIRVHQKGFGAVGVSKKYGKRSYARYPIFWGLSKIRSLPNPDPSDTGEWNPNEYAGATITVDREFEAGRGDLRRQAQEWAGLEQNPTAELFVFVGRWSMQKGVDLIADVFPSVLANNPNTQIIAIGPVIDLYGRFAALKLEKLTKLYPGRVFSRPEFTQLPPYIFSGAEFALIPSRDEPFGLVAVEFGRKGALGVGSKVGGLGQMPGWWFTIESNATKHLIKQFKTAINEALASSQETRSMMRARSAKQRFPVAQWVEDLSKLQSTAIRTSRENWNKSKASSVRNIFSSRPGSRAGSPNASQLDISWPLHGSPGQDQALMSAPPSPLLTPRLPYSDNPSPRLSVATTSSFGDLAPPPISERGLSIYGSVTSDQKRERRLSNLSIHSVVGERTDFALQKVDPFFTDSSGHYYREFEKKLDNLGPKNSETDLCIEEIITKSEKKWFEEYRGAKLGQSSKNASSISLHKGLKRPSPGLESSASSIRSFSRNGRGGEDSFFHHYSDDELDDTMSTTSSYNEEFELGENYIPPTGLRRFMLRKVLDWPIYTFVLAFGQIIAANSYQITLLTGEVGQGASTLYVIASIYAITSVLWWFAFRRLKSLWVLSLPFALYGVAFLFIGVAPFVSMAGRGWVQKVASGFYTTASSSGSIYFALNFGDEGGAPVKTWVLRACIIQGTQQIYVSALWFWGSALSRLSDEGVETTSVAPTAVIAGVCLPVAVLLFALAVITFMGLPKYYHQVPGAVPSFYKSIYRRKIILWFFVAVVIQNFWLASQYGRNWRFLWTSHNTHSWQILILLLFFFLGVWAFSLWVLGRLTKAHSWILPIFAIGLGAPRWCQMLWGTSGVAAYLPWTSSPVTSALLARALWLYLGVLDALQGVGFGMILLQTMTRFHNTFALIAAQFLGSIATIIGRAIAPNNLGPGPVFPNFALGAGGLANAWFWICLLMQIAICIGFALFFRREQLSKP